MGVGLQNDMQVFLQLLKQKVASEEAAAASAAVDSDQPDSPTADSSGLPWSLPRVMERSVQYTNGDTYKGAMLEDQRHGFGTHTTSVGDVFEGNWLYDLRHGPGKFTMKDGTTYTGDWEDDKAHGTGVCLYPDGSRYEGEWQADMRCGWGAITTADGQVYEGEWRDNVMHGDGRWVFSDGLSYLEGSYEKGERKHGQLVMFDPDTKKQVQSYTGSFRGNLRHGNGVGVEEGLWVYRGSWSRDMRHGQGTCTYADGSVYEGAWKSDKRDGVGKVKLSGGYTYDGEWKNDKQHGTGKARYANGDRYTGQWQKGKRHGHGKWTSAPIPVPAGSSSSSAEEGREQYVGCWVNDCREGQGLTIYADGGRYQGSWKCDKRHGEGLMMFADGVTFRGQWEDDVWVQSAADPALTRLKGLGLSRATAGQAATFAIKARDENNQPRLSGGDTFNVLLAPRVRHETAAAQSVYAATAGMQTAATGMETTAAQAVEEVNGLTHAGATTLQASARPAHGSGDGLVQGQPEEPVAGRSRLISHPILMPMGSSSDCCSSGTRGSTVLLQQVAGEEVKSQASETTDSHLSVQEVDADCDALFENDEDSLHKDEVVAVAVGDVQDNGDGTYRCSYMYNTAGLYELHIINGEGEHVADSPYPVKVLPGPASARHTAATGLGRHTATAGATAEFVVEVRDAFGNGFELQEVTGKLLNIQAQLLGSNTLPVADVFVSAVPGGRYRCSYTAPHTTGLYVLEVTAEGKHLRGSPFSVKVTEAEQIAADEAMSAAAATALVPTGAATTTHHHCAASAAAGEAVSDRVKWWGEVAREAYAAVDGCLDGFDESSGPGCQGDDLDQAGLSGPEAELVKANPDIPVVERLEDLWLLSKLQQEKKLKQQQQQRKQQKQQRQAGSAQRATAGDVQQNGHKQVLSNKQQLQHAVHSEMARPIQQPAIDKETTASGRLLLASSDDRGQAATRLKAAGTSGARYLAGEAKTDLGGSVLYQLD